MPDSDHAQHPLESPCPLPNKNASASFWLSEPQLRGFRSTKSLPDAVDVAVIGTGVTGAHVLRYLCESRQSGLRILALEAREVCSGATGRNGGHLQAVPYARSPGIGAFEMAGCNELASYIVANDVSCEYRELPAVRTFWTDDGLAQMTPKVEQLKRDNPDIGSTISIVTDKEELSKLGIQDGCKGALVNHHAASLWPYKLIAHIMQRLVEDQKIDLQTNTPVNRLERNDDGRWNVSTMRGNILAKSVVLATNAYTSHLIPRMAPLIVPARGYMTALTPPRQMDKLLSKSYALIAFSEKAGGDLDEDDYLMQRPSNLGPDHKAHLMFGGGHYNGLLPSIGSQYADDSIVDTGAIDYLRQAILQAFNLPGLPETCDKLNAEYAWSGIMGYSRDNRPWVGEVPDMPGVFMSAGYTGHGLPNGPLCAKAVVEMITEAKSGAQLIDEGKLPRDYLITEERIAAAMRLPSLIEDDFNPKGEPKHLHATSATGT